MFTLHTDRGTLVTCFLDPGDEAMMPQSWGELVSVEGWITRDRESGRPLEIHRITRIEAVSQVPPGSYQFARGVLPMEPGQEPPDVAIRRLRDEGEGTK